jgi:integrase/recombinase XerD
MKKTFTSCIGHSIGRYLQLMESLGRRFAQQRRLLTMLDDFLIAVDAHEFRQPQFDSWCTTQMHLSATSRLQQLRIIRNFCLYRRRARPDSFVPSTDLFPQPNQVIRPYWFSEGDVTQLLKACATKAPSPRSPLRPQVYRLAIVLLYCTGLRRGELIRLTLNDYDASAQTLYVRESKFHKSRYLALSVDANREIEQYLKMRRRLGMSMRLDAPLLCRGKLGAWGYSGNHLRDELHIVMQVAGVRKPDGRVPRIHDYRHGFAISALLRFYRAGFDLQTKLPLVGAYMGHASINATEYYLSFVPELAAAASERFSARFGNLVQALPEVKHHD